MRKLNKQNDNYKSSLTLQACRNMAVVVADHVSGIPHRTAILGTTSIKSLITRTMCRMIYGQKSTTFSSTRKTSVIVYVFLLPRVIYIYVCGRSLLTTPNLQQSLRKTTICTTMKTVTSLLVFLVIACLLIAQHPAGKLATTHLSSQHCMLDSNNSYEFQVFYSKTVVFLLLLRLPLHYNEWAKLPFES